MIEMIRNRAKLLSLLRSFFDSRGFIEVQPPTVCRDCVVDAYLDPITIPALELGLPKTATENSLYFLQTSPESAMKRMLSELQSDGGEVASIYSIGPVYRKAETGAHHNVEFTMLEWYEVGGDAESAICLLGSLALEALSAPGAKLNGFEVISYRELFRSFLEIDPIETSISGLYEKTRPLAPEMVDTIRDDRDAMLDVLFGEVIQPNLGNQVPAIVRDYPLSQAALAKPSELDPQCAARFELFVRGVELANGYDELTDAEVFRQRAIANNQSRQRRGASEMVVESTLYHAMQAGLPKCAGVALGVDRLQMVCTGKTTIDQVIPMASAEA